MKSDPFDAFPEFAAWFGWFLGATFGTGRLNEEEPQADGSADLVGPVCPSRLGVIGDRPSSSLSYLDEWRKEKP
jgi:hypothetical protein